MVAFLSFICCACHCYRKKDNFASNIYLFQKLDNFSKKTYVSKFYFPLQLRPQPLLLLGHPSSIKQV